MINSQRAKRRATAREAVEVFETVKNLSLKFLDQAKGLPKSQVLDLFSKYQTSWDAERKAHNKLGKGLYLKQDGLKNYVLGMEKHLHHAPIEMQSEYKKVIVLVAGGKINYLFSKLKKKINEKAN